MMGGADPYDLLPYHGVAIPPTRPEHLALCSWIYGGPLPRRRGYSVLEIGCAEGSNLLPLAFYRPDITALGVDRSRLQIAEARSAVDSLGLENVRFECLDLRELADQQTESPFDFIIAHGVLSWIPMDAQEALLELCSRRLAPRGLVYMSYNVDPGWRLRGVVREVMLREVGDIRDVPERTRLAQESARGYLELITPYVDHPYCAILQRELELLAKTDTSKVAHDQLEENNHAFFFHELNTRIERHGLVHVADAGFEPTEGACLVRVRESLQQQGLSGVNLELCSDLLCNRQLRSSVLCSAEDFAPPGPGAAVLMSEDITLETRLSPTRDSIDLAAGVEELFADRSGLSYRCDDPLLKAALFTLARAETKLPTGPDVLREAERTIESTGMTVGRGQADELVQDLFELHERGLIRLWLDRPRLAEAYRPVAHDLARLEASRGVPLTTPWHTQIVLEDEERELIARLDGEADLEAEGIEELIQALGAAGLLVRGDNSP